MATIYSPLIAAEVLDLCRALGDPSGPTHVQTALSMWTASQLPEGQFVDLLTGMQRLAPQAARRPHPVGGLLTALRRWMAEVDADPRSQAEAHAAAEGAAAEG